MVESDTSISLNCTVFSILNIAICVLQQIYTWYVSQLCKPYVCCQKSGEKVHSQCASWQMIVRHTHIHSSNCYSGVGYVQPQHLLLEHQLISHQTILVCKIERKVLLVPNAIIKCSKLCFFVKTLSKSLPFSQLVRTTLR